MDRAPDPLHYWWLALGKTAEWLLAYAKQHAPPGPAVSAEVEVSTMELPRARRVGPPPEGRPK
jgi:hypothetical protein